MSGKTQVMKCSYVYPTAVHKQKLNKMLTLNSIYPQLCPSKHYSGAHENFHSMKNIEKLKDKSNKEKQTVEKMLLPAVEKRESQAKVFDCVLPVNNNISGVIKPVPRRKPIEKSLKSMDIYFAFEDEREEIIKNYQWNPAKWKQWQVPNKNLENLKINTEKQNKEPSQKGQKSEQKQQTSPKAALRFDRILMSEKQASQKPAGKNNRKFSSEFLKEISFEKLDSAKALGLLEIGKKQSAANFDTIVQQINISNGIFFESSAKKIFVFVGKGNNRPLVEQLFKKRFNFQVTKNIREARIIWQQKSHDDYFCSKAISLRETTYRQLVQQKQVSKQIILSSSSLPKILQKPNIFSASDCEKISGFYGHQNRIKFHPKSLGTVVQNHLPNHRQISDKKSLYTNMKQYCSANDIDLDTLMPRTFLVTKDLQELDLYLRDHQHQNMWIIKPAQNSNQGKGISIVTQQSQLFNVMYNCQLQPQELIVQQYLTDCLLYNRRKFDIRSYMLVTNHGTPKCYWYNDGYVRLSGHKFDKTTNSSLVHLTNDSIQCSSEFYGRYETCNKISLPTLERYFNNNFPRDRISLEIITRQMKAIVNTILDATLQKLIGDSQFNYEVFGLDFMIDQDFKVSLIQINTNPSIETNCPLLERIIPSMLQQAFRIAIDPVFKASGFADQNRTFQKGKFEVLR